MYYIFVMIIIDDIIFMIGWVIKLQKQHYCYLLIDDD